jgi:hypothetical protein
MNEMLKEMGTTLAMLREFIVEKSPEVYEIIYNQIMLRAGVEYVIAVIASVILGLLLLCIITFTIDGDAEEAAAACMIAFVFIAIITTILYVNWYMYKANPDYYVIKEFLSTFGGK